MFKFSGSFFSSIHLQFFYLIKKVLIFSAQSFCHCYCLNTSGLHFTIPFWIWPDRDQHGLIKYGDKKSIMIIIALIILVSSKILLHFNLFSTELLQFLKTTAPSAGARFSMIAEKECIKNYPFHIFLKNWQNRRQNFQPFKIVMELESFLTGF